MIPSSYAGVVFLVMAVLPGAIFTWAFERRAGSFEVTFADRLLRFVAASAALAIVLAPPLYVLWRAGLKGARSLAGGEFLTLYLCGLILVAGPGAAGLRLGNGYETAS